MFSRYLIIALGVALLLVGFAMASADYDDNMADAIKKLQQLDRYYSQLARPRFGKRAFSHVAWERENPVDVDIPDNWAPFPRRR